MAKQRVSWSEYDKAWLAFVRFPDGKRRKVKATDRDKAQAKLDALIAQRDRGLPVDERKHFATFNEVVEAWLAAGCPNSGLGAGNQRRHHTTKGGSTYDQVESLLRNNITRPEFVATYTKPDGSVHPVNRKYPATARIKASVSGLKIDRTAPETVEAVFAAMDSDGLMSSTVHRTWGHLNNALSWGQRQRLNETNPAADVLLPAVKPGRVIQSLNPESARTLFGALPHERELLAPLWLTALMVGTRPGEILGIRWAWVNLDGEGTPSFAVEEKANERKGRYIGQGDPKARSFRTVALHPINVAALVKHRENLIALGRYQPEGFVFPTAAARPHSKSNARKYFRRFVTEAGLTGEGWTTNSLRHSFATIADDLLDDHRKQIGSVMGHTKGATTDGYIHTPDKRPVIAHAVAVWDAFLRDEAS